MPSPARHIAAIAVAVLLAPKLAHADAVHIETSGVVFDTGWPQRAETLASDLNGAATFAQDAATGAYLTAGSYSASNLQGDGDCKDIAISGSTAAR